MEGLLFYLTGVFHDATIKGCAWSARISKMEGVNRLYQVTPSHMFTPDVVKSLLIEEDGDNFLKVTIEFIH